MSAPVSCFVPRFCPSFILVKSVSRNMQSRANGTHRATRFAGTPPSYPSRAMLRMNGRCVVELRLDGKLALVTGGDSGIGRAIAMRMAASGADVAITYFTDREGAERTAHEIQEFARRSFVAQCDVGESREVEHLFTALDTDFGPVDILVNSAGIYHHSMIAEMPDAIWDRVLKTNLYGPFYCSRAVVTRMLARGVPGRIINISSVHEEACGVGG